MAFILFKLAILINTICHGSMVVKILLSYPVDYPAKSKWKNLSYPVDHPAEMEKFKLSSRSSGRNGNFLE